MITAENAERKNAFKKAREARIKEQNELVHREMHPLFQKTDEELREYDAKQVLHQGALEQRRRSKDMAGWNAQAERGGDSEDGSEGSVRK